MDRYRLIASIVALFIYLLVLYPWPTIIITVILVIAYLLLRGTPNISEQASKKNLREAALRSASMYLAPYTNIWNNLKLSNKFCYMRLGAYGSSITARDIMNPDRSFRVIKSRIHTYDNLWNMFCLHFSYNTTFDELVELSKRFDAIIELTVEQEKVIKNEKPVAKLQVPDSAKIVIKRPEKPELLDVNNASEVELTALPGISIVIAKKIIKKREEIGGFKNINEFLAFTQLKPHMRLQLRDLVCVKKMKGSGNIKRYDERSIDL